MEQQLETVGQRIVYARLVHPGGRLTQVELARRASVSQKSLSLLETDETKNPNSDLIVRLAHALYVTTDWLLTGSESCLPPTTLDRSTGLDCSIERREPASPE